MLTSRVYIFILAFMLVGIFAGFVSVFTEKQDLENILICIFFFLVCFTTVYFLFNFVDIYLSDNIYDIRYFGVKLQISEIIRIKRLNADISSGAYISYLGRLDYLNLNGKNNSNYL